MNKEEFFDANFEVIGYTKTEAILLCKDKHESIKLPIEDIQRLLTKMVLQYNDVEAMQTLDNILGLQYAVVGHKGEKSFSSGVIYRGPDGQIHEIPPEKLSQ